jgi:hypothetical protein
VLYIIFFLTSNFQHHICVCVCTCICVHVMSEMVVTFIHLYVQWNPLNTFLGGTDKFEHVKQ